MQSRMPRWKVQKAAGLLLAEAAKSTCPRSGQLPASESELGQLFFKAKAHARGLQTQSYASAAATRDTGSTGRAFSSEKASSGLKATSYTDSASAGPTYAEDAATSSFERAHSASDARHQDLSRSLTLQSQPTEKPSVQIAGHILCRCW